MQLPKRAAAICPRCGYDLGGAQSARTDGGGEADRGVCSECGLGFAWADVLDPARRHVRWLYDHAAGRRPRLLRAAKTWVATAAPWWFWKRVEVGTRVGVWRLLVWLPLLILPLHIIWSVSLTVVRVNFLKQAFFGKMPAVLGTDYETTLFNSWVFPFGGFKGNRTTGLTWITNRPDASVMIPLAVSVVVPVALLAMTRSRAAGKGGRVRAAHVLRAGVYGMSWLVGWWLFWSVQFVLRAMSDWDPRFSLPEVGDRARLAAIKLGLNDDVFGNPRVWMGALWVAWVGAWWWFALRRGFGLKHAGWVWAALMTAALVAGAGCAMADKAFVTTLVRWIGY